MVVLRFILFIIQYVFVSVCGYVHERVGAHRGQSLYILWLTVELGTVGSHLVWVLGLETKLRSSVKQRVLVTAIIFPDPGVFN